MELKNYWVRKIEEKDVHVVSTIIRKVMTETGASGVGFAMHDPEVDRMFVAYQTPGASYFVIEKDGTVLGGGGIAPLKGEEKSHCELQKMYFLAELRGKGMGQVLLNKCLDEANFLGFQYCYLETLKTMVSARALYEKNGFQKSPKPLGKTGHFGCDTWYVKKLI